MKREISFILLLSVLGLANMAFNAFTNWRIQEDNNCVELAGTEINGTFSGLNSGSGHPEQGALAGSIEACSLSTDFLKTVHVFSKETLDVEKYPAISFISDAISKKGDLYKTPGETTVMDVTKRIIISFHGSDVFWAFNGDFKICPNEYNLTAKEYLKESR